MLLAFRDNIIFKKFQIKIFKLGYKWKHRGRKIFKTDNIKDIIIRVNKERKYLTYFSNYDHLYFSYIHGLNITTSISHNNIIFVNNIYMLSNVLNKLDESGIKKFNEEVTDILLGIVK